LKTGDTAKTAEIRLPKPVNHKEYNPQECVKVFKSFEERTEEILGQNAGTMATQSYLKRVKEEMISKKYVPVKSSQLNDTIKASKEGRVLLVIWGMDGRRAIMNLDELRGQFDEYSTKHVNKGWNNDNTLNALWDKKQELAIAAGKDPDDVKKPDKETVSAYHPALLSEVDLARRKAASKSIHRQAGETSKRSMMTNAAGSIAVSFFIDVRWDGTFSDLTLYIGLSWNPNSVNEYLTNKSNGLFIWDEVSIKKLNESKVTGDLQSKKLIFICCMIKLVYSLMLELESVPITPFQPFVGVGTR